MGTGEMTGVMKNCPIKQDISYKTVNFPPRGTKAILLKKII